MPNRRHFCSLCGSPLKSHGGGSSIKSDWSKLIRAVRVFDGAPSDKQLPELSGPGYLVPSRRLSELTDCIAASWGPACTGDEAAPEKEKEEHQLLDRGEESIAYGFHEFCWQLLLSHVESVRGSRPDPIKLGQWLFYVCNALPWTMKGGLNPSHQYFGGIEMRRDPEKIKSMIADPNQEITRVHPLLNRRGQPVRHYNPGKTEYLKGYDPTSAQDPFTKLYPQVLGHLFTFLSTKDLLNARLSSRHIALYSTESGLPLDFWASRFDHDMEMGFVFAHKSKVADRNRLDWLQMYRDCREVQQEKYDLRFTGRGGYKGFLNRKRIWRCIEEFSDTLTPLLQRPIGKGPTLAPGNDQDEHLYIPGSRELGSGVSSQTKPGSGHVLPGGAKTLATTDGTSCYMMPLRSEDLQSPVLLQASTIHLDGRNHISGFRVSNSTNGHIGFGSVYETGLLLTSRLTSITLEPDEIITDVDVHHSEKGILGFHFYAQKSSSERTIKSLGNVGALTGGIWTAIPRRTIADGIVGLIVEFDFFKLLAVALIEA